MKLPDAQELLERTIFHSLRMTIVEAGYLPNVMSYDLQSSDPLVRVAEAKRYNNDIDTIRNNKGYAIEIFNNTTGQEKGTLKVPRIVVETESFLPGTLGLDTTVDYEKKIEGDYNVWDNAFLTRTSDFYFHVKLLSKTIEQEGVLNGIMLLTLPRRGYMKWWDRDRLFSNNIFVNYTSHSEDDMGQEGITEKSHRYEITDVRELDPVLLGSVPPIKEINPDDIINFQFE